MSAPVEYARRLVAAVGAVAGVLGAQQDAVLLDVEAPAATIVEQSTEIRIEVLLERQFFATQAVPMLQRAVDLPVQLLVPWLQDSEQQSVAVLAGDGPRLVVGEQIARAVAAGTVERDGRRYDRFAVHISWTGLVAREHVLEPVVVRFAYASAFEETLLGGRQPVDRREGEATGPSVSIAVRELPPDAPAGFSGAVGEFTVSASASVAEVEVGDNFDLELRVQGRGNLRRFAAPPWPDLPGFAVQGLAERGEGDVRTFGFDVVALRAGATLPPLSFAFFSPSGNDYRTVTAAPVPLRVVARDPGRPLSERLQRLVAASGSDQGIAWYWWLTIAIGIIGPALALLGRRRRRS